MLRHIGRRRVLVGAHGHHQDHVRVGGNDGLHAQVLQQAVVAGHDVVGSQLRQHGPGKNVGALGLRPRGVRPDEQHGGRSVLHLRRRSFDALHPLLLGGAVLLKQVVPAGHPAELTQQRAVILEIIHPEIGVGHPDVGEGFVQRHVSLDVGGQNDEVRLQRQHLLQTGGFHIAHQRHVPAKVQAALLHRVGGGPHQRAARKQPQLRKGAVQRYHPVPALQGHLRALCIHKFHRAVLCRRTWGGRGAGGQQQRRQQPAE